MPLSAAGMGIVRHCPASPFSVPKRALDGTFQSPDIIINFGYMKYWEIRLSLTHHYRICILTCPETAGFSPETSRSYVPHSNFNFQYRPVFVPIDLNVTIKVIKRNHLINQMNLFFQWIYKISRNFSGAESTNESFRQEICRLTGWFSVKSAFSPEIGNLGKLFFEKTLQ